MEHIDILFFDPPSKQFDDDTFRFGSLYQADLACNLVFNPGLLSIASYVLDLNATVKVIHVRREQDIQQEVMKAAAAYDPAVVAISCSYMHTYLPSLELAALSRKYFRDPLIIGGGEHLGNIDAIALQESDFDIIIRGEGERAVARLLDVVKHRCSINEIGSLCFRRSLVQRFRDLNEDCFSPVEYTDFADHRTQKRIRAPELLQSAFCEPLVPLDDMPFLRYDLYENYLQYPPYLEESRGCYAGCRYCVSATCRTYRNKRAERFLDELDYVISIYGTKNVIPFTAANFGVNVKNTRAICQGIIDKYKTLRWMAEFRLDLRWEEYIDLMYQSGCVVFNVGLESASPEILRIMNKTSDPLRYLERAEQLMEKIRSFKNAYAHVNFMFYIGESATTLAENMAFLTRYYNVIESMHYSPLVLYPCTGAWDDFDDYHQKYGTTIVKTHTLDRLHAYPVNPSSLYSYEEACFFSRVVEKMFIHKEGYRLNHETRVIRDADGNIAESTREAYLKRMME